MAMASMMEPDYRTLSHFPIQQALVYRQAPYTPPPPPYYAMPNVGCSPALSYVQYFPQTPLNSIHHVHNEYDGFVNGVISDVLLRVDDGFTYKQPQPVHDEKILPSNHYAPSSSGPEQNLMWGSDVSFGPNGYHPDPASSPEIKAEQDPAPLYGLQEMPSSASQSVTPSPSQTPKLKPQPQTQPEPETPTTLPSDNADELQLLQQSPEFAELSKGGLQKITGKKRRRLLHIIAERNRRLHQNKMYEELYKMVPGLENSSRSTKREVLFRTADFLEDLVKENQRLQQQLSQLPLPSSHQGYMLG
ncbi:hypothetical protein BDW74DRAFT_180208 [Aspergillus multicolor]|uniref:uncharacterized protein n=1 Tax=Aspergillus multicolor TaxID=41759 RepID=UPI003CCD7B8B